MRRNPFFDFSHLTPAQRIELAQDLWDSIDPAAGVAQVPLTEEQRAELDSRLEDLEKTRRQGPSWDEVKARLLDRLERERRQKRGA
jgi:putative addiction module component (TIGR02574 family)